MTLDEYIKAKQIVAGSFAEQIGMSIWRLSKIRRGHNRPTLDEALAIERATKRAVPVQTWERQS